MSKACYWSCFLLFGWTTLAGAAERNGCQVEILIDGRSAPEFVHEGSTYIEAVKGREYAIRLINPFGVRVAVALSVDGLNTIDAHHTDAYSARKWVLGPYESVTIRGWQTSSSQARRFFFTSEEESYGSWLGKTENLGMISAVFLKEKSYWREPSPQPLTGMPQQSRSRAEEQNKEAKPADSAAGDLSGTAPSKDDYAATGIGRRLQNDVRRIFMDLEPSPAATLNVRYEYRPTLTKLGIFPPMPYVDPIYRREHAKGFQNGGYCPDPR
jgi:hypothetical protein